MPHTHAGPCLAAVLVSIGVRVLAVLGGECLEGWGKDGWIDGLPR